MALSSDLQDMVADVSAAIAGAQTLGRAELEIWRRKLNAAAEESREAESRALVTRNALKRLATGIDRRVKDLDGLARFARDEAAIAIADQVPA